MDYNDLRVRILQALRIISPEDPPVSGTNFIGVAARLQYEELYPLEDDGDLVYKAYIDAEIVVAPLEFDESNLSGSDGNFYLDFTPPTGFKAYFTNIIYADGSETSNNAIYTKAASPSNIVTQYAFTNNDAQTIKVYLIKQ